MARLVKHRAEVPASTLDDWDLLAGVERVLLDVRERWGPEVTYSVEVTDETDRTAGGSLAEVRSQIDAARYPVRTVALGVHPKSAPGRLLNMYWADTDTDSPATILHLDREFEKEFVVRGTTIEEATVIVDRVLDVTGTVPPYSPPPPNVVRRARRWRWVKKHAESIITGALGSVVGGLVVWLILRGAG